MCCLPTNQISTSIKGKLVGVNLLGNGENSFEISLDGGKREKQKSHMSSFNTFEEYLRYEHRPAYKVNCVRCKNDCWVFEEPSFSEGEKHFCYECISILSK